MQLYSKDGMEIREVQFTNEEVQNYCELLNIKYNHYVPTLMCAKLWPQFELFQSFSKKPIILKETHIKTQHQLQVDCTYEATLHKVSQKLIKNIIKYTYGLEINKDKKHCMYIKQIFIEVR